MSQEVSKLAICDGCVMGESLSELNSQASTLAANAAELVGFAEGTQELLSLGVTIVDGTEVAGLHDRNIAAAANTSLLLNEHTLAVQAAANVSCPNPSLYCDRTAEYIKFKGISPKG